MKFTTTALLLGAVAAKRHGHQHQQHFVDHCPVKYPRMSESKFMRSIYYTSLNGMIKGYYNDQRPHPLDERCLGDWID